MTDIDQQHYPTSRLAALAGYSVQQVRDLERIGVIPPATRQPNGYRQFTEEHLKALRAYRGLAVAVGPVVARTTMGRLLELPHDVAVASIVALHADLARSREETLAALQALDSIVDESANEAPPAAGDSLTITELAAALGVRASTLRFWEQQGLLSPERTGGVGARHYPPVAVRDARIIVALRAGGYRIPAVRSVMASLRGLDQPADAREALESRLSSIAARSEALLRVGSEIADLLGR